MPCLELPGLLFCTDVPANGQCDVHAGLGPWVMVLEGQWGKPGTK